MAMMTINTHNKVAFIDINLISREWIAYAGIFWIFLNSTVPVRKTVPKTFSAAVQGEIMLAMIDLLHSRMPKHPHVSPKNLLFFATKK